MSKGTKYVLIIIIVAIAVLATYVGYNETNKNNENVATDSTNTSTNNISNEVQNNNITQNNNVVDNNVVETDPNKEIIKSDTLTDEEKAKELVKKEWGGSDGVYFSIDNMNSDETYIVSVRDSETTKVLEWYKVDIKTGEVTVN